jgi:hypothetical protein
MTDKAGGITVLFKGGRLATWHALPQKKRHAYEQEHVDLMLDIAMGYGLRRMEGFRLMAPQGAYERFWVLDFPDLAGAQAWIAAEMAPPYGRYGFYEYHLSQGGLPDYCADWAQGMPAPAPYAGDPHRIPRLDVDSASVVAMLFERSRSGLVAEEKALNGAYTEAMGAICKTQGLLRLERFRLVAPQAHWDQVWLAEFPTFGGAEAWIQAERDPAHGCCQDDRSFVLTRKWAPAYFASWVPNGKRDAGEA